MTLLLLTFAILLGLVGTILLPPKHRWIASIVVATVIVGVLCWIVTG